MKDKRIAYFLFGTIGIFAIFFLCSGLATVAGGGKFSPDHKLTAEIVGGDRLVISQFPPGVFNTPPCFEVDGKILGVRWKSNQELDVEITESSKIKDDTSFELKIRLNVKRLKTP